MNDAKKAALAAIDEKKELVAEVADAIWDYAELSMQEVKSAALFVKVLKAEGFQLIDEDVRQIVLAHGAGDGGAVRVGGGVDRNIFEQTFVSAHENRSPL